MQQYHKLFAFATGISLITSLSACQNSTTNNNTQASDSTSKAPVSIAPVTGSPEFPDATLQIKDIQTSMVGKDSVKITFNYDVKNYELKAQTNDAADKQCNNSDDGQHIHFILDNGPYNALYKPTHSFTVAVNSKHYVMSFLSRSYHESLKTPKAAVLEYFSVDAQGKISKLPIPTTPMVFYSRPKGEYLGKDTKNVLLDFYVFNASLSPDGTQVKATIDGKDFMIDKWQPYFIQNAPLGDLTVQLQLVDKDGKALVGDNTSVSRTIKLASDEPIK